MFLIRLSCALSDALRNKKHSLGHHSLVSHLAVTVGFYAAINRTVEIS